MATYQIITDSACDLPKSMLGQLDVLSVPLHILFRGQNLPDSVDEGLKEIYDGLRAGEPASTCAANPDGWRAAMEPVLAQGMDVLVLAFSSALSTTYQSAVIAAQELSERYPQREIRVIDTGSAALGQGFFVFHACQQRDRGLSLEALAQWCLENKGHMCHWFTVDDLMFLKRGGRISGATAVLGTMLQIKPVLHVDDEGRLINMEKARGRKASMDALVRKVRQLGQGYNNRIVFVCHGDCPQEAAQLQKQLLEIEGIEEVFVGNLGAVIGAHAGPGTLAVFFLGSHR
jgi:DegV family protein with EDD domain